MLKMLQMLQYTPLIRTSLMLTLYSVEKHDSRFMDKEIQVSNVSPLIRQN